MKKILLMLTLGCALVGCRSKIDLGNVDAKVGLDNMGFALPIGRVHATLKDIIGDVDKMYIDTLDHEGVITWRDTFPDGRSYHQIDLAKHISTKTFPLDVYDQLAAYATGGVVTGTGMPITLHFDMPLKLNGINNELSEERLDSAQIMTANFFSTLATENFGMQWDWMDTVRLDLGDQISRSAGNSMIVYQKGMSGNFNQEIETAIDNFTLIMMKNRNLNPKTDYDKYSNNNVIDSTTFHVHMTFTIPVGESVTIYPSSKLSYDLKVNFITYRAIWGFFKPSNDMFAEVLADVGESWNSLTFLRNGTMPFSDPYIKVDINTAIAGHLRIDSCYVFAQDVNANRVYALFNGKTIERDIRLHGDFLDPYLDPIGKKTLLWTDFDKSSEKGQIDRLFGKMPDKVGYKFKVDFDMQRSPQVRITPDDSIRINAICTLPFIFNQGVFVNYPDTFSDVNLSQYSLDSLQANSEVIDTISTSGMKIILHATNSIPLHVKGTMRCYDANGQVIMDPNDSSKPFYLFDTDTITFEPPTFAKNSGKWVPTTDGQTTIISSLTQDDLNELPNVKKISLNLFIDDKALKYAYDQGMTNISLREEQGLTIKLGVSANVSAVLNFNNDKE